MTRRKLILDTDPGIDDAFAMAMLASLPSLELLAVTTVFGNADVETTTRNAAYLCQQLGLDVPLYRGASTPLRRPRGCGAPHVHGDNGLGSVAVPEVYARPAGTPDAAETIVELVRAHPRRVTLLAIGPLTNLALALRLDPTIADLVEEVVVMGGAFGTGGRWGNVTPMAEANIHNDPDAAAAVLSAPWRVTLVGLDVTARCILSTTRATDLRRAGRGGEMLWDLSRFYADAYARFDGLDGCCLHDVAALALLVAPDLFGSTTGRVKVTVKGPEAGHTRLVPDLAGFHRVCVEVNADRLIDFFLSVVATASADQMIVQGLSGAD
ncbi:MAG: nucleoside hydrolase [Niveispirillum sp.]|uniref:nucleoside hydrolase n=1 Tax=Niveispirillum sp. TaxID=1917217 RepID=UPI003BA7768B